MSASPFSFEHNAMLAAKASPLAGRKRALGRRAARAVLGRLAHKRRIDLDQCPLDFLELGGK